MSIIADLLKDTPLEVQKDYQSYLLSHIKLLMTSINKCKVQDITQVEVRKNKCIQQCYRLNISDEKGSISIHDTVQQIRQCKRKCGQEKKVVRKYLDDINFYSSLKLQRCRKDCEGNERQRKYNQCLWGCYNRLDRRYKDYWMKKRFEIENKFYPQANNQTIKQAD